MLLVVSDSFSLSSQNATLEEKMARADIWARVLFDVVPANKLQIAFDRAFAEHSSPFPVNAYEIKAAWDVIKREERDARIAAEKEERKENPVQFCPVRNEHVTDDGEVDIIDLKNPSELIRLPCKVCRPKAYDAARERHILANGGFQPRPLEVLETAIKRPTHLTIPETALEIIVRASNEVGQEIMRDPNNGELRQAKETLTNAWRYCYENQ